VRAESDDFHRGRHRLLSVTFSQDSAERAKLLSSPTRKEQGVGPEAQGRIAKIAHVNGVEVLAIKLIGSLPIHFGASHRSEFS